jgi:hypothetical protein
MTRRCKRVAGQLSPKNKSEAFVLCPQNICRVFGNAPRSDTRLLNARKSRWRATFRLAGKIPQDSGLHGLAVWRGDHLSSRTYWNRY